MHVGILTNLNSRKNRYAHGRAERLREFAGAGAVIRQTRSLDEIRPVLEEFVDRDCRYWISDGGDGTLHWMLNEGFNVLQERGRLPDGQLMPCVVPTNGGTIDFVARKAGIKGRPDEIIHRLVDGLRSGIDFPTVEINSIEVTGHRPTDPVGTWPFRRIGFAVAVGGIGQKFFTEYYRASNPNPWTIIEISMKASLGFVADLPVLRRLPIVSRSVRECGRWMLSGTRARVTADGRTYPYEVFQGLHAGSVDVDFGTMKLFPYAREPGKLHLVIGAMDRWECAWKWVFLAAGKPVPGKTWHEFAGEWMEVEARGEDLLDPIIDGERFFGLDRVRLQVGPRIRVPRIPGRPFGK